jgi:superfamily II DNA or RNA helicase
LVKQILDEWNERFIADDKFPSILVICSDDTVKKENDPYVSSVSEIIQETTTDKEKIKKFLNRDDEFQLVISTYQSGEKLIEASKESNTVFDFAIYDEAHRTVGGKNFGALVLDENIKINQKLFMTATEKFFLGNSENDDPLSMDNQEFYGSKTVSRSYKEIIELDESPIIDYKILTLGISKQEILDYWKIDSNILVKYDGKNEGMLRVLSVGILQKKLFEEFGVRLSISFHSALKRAKDLVQIIENLKKSNDYPQLETFFIEGSQNSSVKKNTLNDFSKSQNAIITNARCLTEGVDVRSVDSVIFSDPKSSVIDIVQASGRALRKSKIFTPRKNMPEQKGIIVIPTIVDKEKNLDDLKESESFKRTIDVVKALATQDDRIVEYFRESKKGGGGGIIEYDGFSSAINFTLKEIEEAIHIQAWEKIAKLNWRSFQEARKFVRLLNLKNQNEYLRDWSKSVERPYDIPANPARTYKDKGWQSWGDFLGTGYIANQNRVFISFEESRKFVRSLKLKNLDEWREWAKSREKPDDIPASPDRTYKDKGWQSFGDFLGTGYIANNKRVYRSFEEARKFVRSLKLKEGKAWFEWAKSGEKPDDIPANPAKIYEDKGWESMGDWLGTGKISNFKRVYRTFEEARKFARSLKLQGQREWFEWAKSVERPHDIPANPERTYKDKGWESMGDFLGTGTIASSKRVFRSFEEARKFARSLKLKEGKEWFEWAKSGEKPDDIPAYPAKAYEDKGWQSMGDWLGSRNIHSSKRVFRSFEEARKFARSLKLKKEREWREWAKSGEKPDDIPSTPDKVYKNKGWINWFDYLGNI